MVSANRTGTSRHLIDSAPTTLRFALVGAGRLGASLGLALRARGATLTGFTASSVAGRARAEGWLGETATLSLRDLVSDAPQLYVIAVPDQAVPEVAAELGRALALGTRATGALASAGPAAATTPVTAEPPIVVHTSGATSVKVLAPCARAGASTLVFHPLQTFSDPRTGSARFRGAAIAITSEGSSPRSPAAVFGFELARTLDAIPFLLPDEKRGLYHAAASFACNYLVTLEHYSLEMFIKAGLPDEKALALFLPLVRATLDNIEEHGTASALTGPLSRGDTRTIACHLDALATYAPHLLPVYRALGAATLGLVRQRGEVDAAAIDDLQHLLHSSRPTDLLPARPDEPER